MSAVIQKFQKLVKFESLVSVSVLLHPKAFKCSKKSSLLLIMFLSVRTFCFFPFFAVRKISCCEKFGRYKLFAFAFCEVAIFGYVTFVLLLILDLKFLFVSFLYYGFRV